MEASVTVTMTNDGLKVQGPTDNPILCLGLLEMGKAAIVAGVMGGSKKSEPSKILTVDGINADRLRNGR